MSESHSWHLVESLPLLTVFSEINKNTVRIFPKQTLTVTCVPKSFVQPTLDRYLCTLSRSNSL